MPYLEAAVLEDLLDLLGREDVLEVTQVFVDRFDVQVGELLELLRLAEADLVHAAEIAHGLKGSAGNLGAHQLSEVAARIEKAARAGDGPGALEVAEGLPEIYQGTLEEMRAHGFLDPVS